MGICPSIIRYTVHFNKSLPRRPRYNFERSAPWRFQGLPVGMTSGTTYSRKASVNSRFSRNDFQTQSPRPSDFHSWHSRMTSSEAPREQVRFPNDFQKVPKVNMFDFQVARKNVLDEFP